MLLVPENRLGAGPEGWIILRGSNNSMQALKSHPFFKGIPFEPKENILLTRKISRANSIVSDLNEEKKLENEEQKS